MTFQKRILTAIATGAVLLNALAPLALADTTITGNGSGSNNTVKESNNQSTSVQQSNNLTVSNNVNSNASTGGNKSDNNTNGSTNVASGNATTNVSVSTVGNANVANVTNNSAAGAGNVTIDGNGAGSKNSVDSKTGALYGNDTTTTVGQVNNADIENNVTANATTGGNRASNNTGGDTQVTSGDASTNVSVNNVANANVANVGDPNADPSLGGTNGDITITGNGAWSKNKVKVDNNNSVALDQENDAVIGNSVDANAKTGGNKADNNTNGAVDVMSGNATSNTSIGNTVNFNDASVSDGSWTGGPSTTIGGNGSKSKTKVDLKNTNGLWVAQDNPASLFNDVSGGAKSGGNKSSNGTGTDSNVQSGGSDSENSVNNTGNVNLFNAGGTSYNASWDLGSLFAFLGGFQI